MCLKEDVQKLRNQIKKERIRNALTHDAILNFADNIQIENEKNYDPKRKHGKY